MDLLNLKRQLNHIWRPSAEGVTRFKYATYAVLVMVVFLSFILPTYFSAAVIILFFIIKGVATIRAAQTLPIENETRQRLSRTSVKNKMMLRYAGILLPFLSATTIECCPEYFFVIINVLLMVSLICFAHSGLPLAFFFLLTAIIMAISLTVSFMQGGFTGVLIALAIIIVAIPIPVREALIAHRIQPRTATDNGNKRTT